MHLIDSDKISRVTQPQYYNEMGYAVNREAVTENCDLQGAHE